MSRDPKSPPPAPQDLFPFDEMSTGETSSMLRRANVITGAPDRPQPQKEQPPLKPMTGAQLAFRPNAPPRPATGTQPAFKPATGTQPAFTPSTGTHAAFKPTSGTQPAFSPTTGKTGTQQFATFKPAPSGVEGPAAEKEEEEESPVFDPERLQAQIRAMSLTDSALGRAAVKSQKPNKAPSSAAEDTFVKTKMKQAEAKVPDFDLDEDLG
jgi:hypothetical protein